MSRSADALRRRKVRGMDLWVEMEEITACRREERASPLGARLEQLWPRCPNRSARRWFFATRRI